MARTDLGSGQAQFDVTFTGDFGPVPDLSTASAPHALTGSGVNTRVAVTRLQAGVAEVQTVTVSAESGFVAEEQTVTHVATGGTPTCAARRRPPS